MKRKAFTLVELIVIITILAILWTISFISLSGYFKASRDAKRLADTTGLLNKINIENWKWTPLNKLIKDWEIVTLQILWKKNTNVQTFRKIDFEVLGENEENFKDPSNKNQNYPIAYALWWKWKGKYRFIQIATISEKENRAVIKWNYYKLEDDDAKSLFLTGGTTVNDWGINIEDWGNNLPYVPNEKDKGDGDSSGWGWAKNFSCTWTLPEHTESFNADSLTKNTVYQNTDENGKCYYKCKSTHTWDWTSCFVETWTDGKGKDWQAAKPKEKHQWAKDNLYIEPTWDSDVQKYTYPTWKAEDYPAFKYCTDLWIWWRLPTLDELRSLAQSNHPWIILDIYWSSTPSATDINKASHLNFEYSHTHAYEIKINTNYVVCIQE